MMVQYTLDELLMDIALALIVLSGVLFLGVVTLSNFKEVEGKSDDEDKKG